MNSYITKSSLEPPVQPQFNQAESSEGKPLNLDLVRSLRMHRWLALSVSVLVLVALVGYGLRIRPYYQTSALIYVQPMKSKVITDPSGGTYDPTRYDTYVQQQLQTIARYDILAEALSTLPPGVWSPAGEPEQVAVARLQTQLKAERDTGSYQISVSLNGNNPDSITKVVNAVTEAYIHRELLDEHAQSDQQLQVLKDERQHLEESIEQIRQEQTKLSLHLGVADTAGQTGNPYDVQLVELRSQLAAARAAHAVAEAQLESVAKGATTPDDVVGAVAEDPTKSDPAEATIMQRRNVLLAQMAGLTPKNPLMKQDEDEIKLLDQMLLDNRTKSADKVLSKLKLEVARTADVQSRLTNQLIEKTSVATGATPELQRAADLAVTIQRLQGRYTEVDNAISAIELEHNSSGLVHLSLPALRPLKPKASRKFLLLGLALPFSLAVGSFAAVAMRKLDPKIYIGADVENIVGFRPMTVLPESNEVSAKVLDECMLRLVAGIDQAHRTGGARTYVFTPVSSETDITNLISTLSQKMDRLGYRTMILKASSALQNLSVGDDKIAKSWGDTRLSRQTGKMLTPIRRESLVVENIEKLKENVDLLFIEALPLLTSAAAEFSARLADVTVLVAQSAKTTRVELKSSLALIQRLNVSGLAAVLDGVHQRHADHEFLTAIREVELRRSEITSPDESSQRSRKSSPAANYEDTDLVSQDHTTSKCS